MVLDLVWYRCAVGLVYLWRCSIIGGPRSVLLCYVMSRFIFQYLTQCCIFLISLRYASSCHCYDSDRYPCLLITYCSSMTSLPLLLQINRSRHPSRCSNTLCKMCLDSKMNRTNFYGAGVPPVKRPSTISHGLHHATTVCLGSCLSWTMTRFGSAHMHPRAAQ